MIWYPHDSIGVTGWVVMVLTMIAFWGVLVWAISLLWRPPRTEQVPGRETPEQLLARRFAAGEITAEDYHQALDVLSGRGQFVGGKG